MDEILTVALAYVWRPSALLDLRDAVKSVARIGAVALAIAPILTLLLFGGDS